MADKPAGSFLWARVGLFTGLEAALAVLSKPAWPVWLSCTFSATALRRRREAHGSGTGAELPVWFEPLMGCAKPA